MYSMTGFGKGTASRDGREMTVEFKSVNHRFLDIGLRLPRHLTCVEDGIRKVIASGISRGHIDVFVSYSNTRSDSKQVRIDESLLAAYITAARSLPRALHLRDDLTITTALKLPDVSEVSYTEEDAGMLAELCASAAADAMEQLIAMRSREGGIIRADLSQKLATMREFAEAIRERAPFVSEEYRQRLNERVAAVLTDTEVDRARLATEIALFTDRSSIDEEIVRLFSHIDHFEQLFSADEPVGRKMDFIVQELNRECNTIGSKANDAALTEIVLACKAEIEKIREQIQNVE